MNDRAVAAMIIILILAIGYGACTCVAVSGIGDSKQWYSEEEYAKKQMKEFRETERFWGRK